MKIICEKFDLFKKDFFETFITCMIILGSLISIDRQNSTIRLMSTNPSLSSSNSLKILIWNLLFCFTACSKSSWNKSHLCIIDFTAEIFTYLYFRNATWIIKLYGASHVINTGCIWSSSFKKKTFIISGRLRSSETNIFWSCWLL